MTGLAVGMTGALFGAQSCHAAEAAAPPPPPGGIGGGGGGRKELSVGEIFKKAAVRAIGGGRSGAAAGVLQVLSLMWLRTTMNYQYKFGGTTMEALQTLYKEGGIGRFYKGLGFSLVQQPLSRFGDTAANAGMVVLLDSFEETRGLPLFVKTASASAAAALWRLLLMPVDTCKTTLQVRGKDGMKILMEKVQKQGVGTFYEGAFATIGSTFVGHYPWFATFNALQAVVPDVQDSLVMKLSRNAIIGLCSSTVSDCCSNSLRVLKTTKQTSDNPISYAEAVKEVLKDGGVQGLFGRGLWTRLLTNGLQSMLFSVVWKLFDEYWK